MNTPQKDTSQTAPELESPKNKWVLLGLAIFCLLIFSITGPMTTVFRNMMNGGPPEMARMDLPSGPAVITLEEYRLASNFMQWDSRIFGGPRSSNEEQVLAMAAKRKLVDDLEIVVDDSRLADFLSMQMQQLRQAEYANIWRGLGFRSALEYEGVLRELLRVRTLGSLLASGVNPGPEETLAQWSKDFSEVRYQWVSFATSEFEKEAAELHPEQEALAAFYENDLDFQQRSQLENEESVAFETLLLSQDSLGTDSVKAWAPSEEPSEEALQAFYDFRRFTLYHRDDTDEKIEENPTLTREELGDQLSKDYRLNRAALELRSALGEAESNEGFSLVDFATEKGVELIRFEEAVPSSEIPKLERVGSAGLRDLAFAELGKWLGEPLLQDGVAVLARPFEQNARAMPELAEVQESVVDFWREKEQARLAREAAEAFVAAVPLAEGALEGDPITQSAEEFAAAVAAAGRVVRVQDWICRRMRMVNDPRWDSEEKVRPWLRNMVGAQAEELLDGEILEPLENAREGIFVVAQLLEQREADSEKMWPGEVDYARRTARQEATRRFWDEGLSYEGLARAYNIEKINSEN
ncbi:MAG: hypothetical protein QGH51_03695 [Planctomycetota bacterium]|jgi:hypothetical protein|nr:hypothetical protein [Planctomycetota bacterium]MDP6941111.1 hypothetical protein [Planctomycetota bacterium]